jgi:serine/threonine protein kinase
MPSPSTVTEFTDLVFRSGVTDEKRLATYLDQLRSASAVPGEPLKLAEMLVRDGLLTRFQAEQIMQGKWKRFTIGKYKVLERLGAGGMGSVYLCEHMLMKRRVAVKVLPAAKAEDRAALERFYREARAVAALDHPNIVRAYDIDQDEKLHFLVMEHVDGASLQEIIKRTGPLEVLRGAHYIRQAALGLQHAHEAANLVHRDIKPGNILVDRNGIVKILDMGLARFFNDDEDILTKKYDENVLGTADYLAPEQALDSHGVDIRADIYSLGCTFYFCLTGHPPFVEGTVAQKLIWHQTRQPRSIRLERPETPEGLVALIERMIAKDPGQRYQSPLEVAEALASWTQTPIPPPPDEEMPQLSRAALPGGPEPSMSNRPTSAMPSPTPRRTWQVNTGNSDPGRGPRTPPVGGTPPGPVSAGPAVAPTVHPSPRPGAAPAPVPAVRPAQAPAATRPAQPIAPSRPAAAAAAVPTAAANGTRSVNNPSAKTRPAPVKQEDSPSWDKLAGDTERASADDTTPRAPRPAARARRHSGKTPSITNDSSRRWLWIGIGAGIALVVALLTILILWLARGNKDDTAGADPPRAPLIVDPTGTNSAYRNVKDALDAAREGDHIVLKGNIKDNVTIVGAGSKNLRNLVIEGEKDQNVVWQPRVLAATGRNTVPVLSLSSVEGLQIRGITFDGSKNADVLIQLYGRCPDLKIEDVKLRDFKLTGILVSNCGGDKDRPMLFSNVKISNQEPKTVGVWFHVNTSIQQIPENSYMTFRDLTLEGQAKAIKTTRKDQLKEVVFAPPIPITEEAFPIQR